MTADTAIAKRWRVPMVVAIAAFVITMAAQIALPLAENRAVPLVTLVVTGLCVTCLALAGTYWPARRLAVASVAVVVLAVLVELMGSKTGFPFGNYAYSNDLQPQVGTVPVVVAMAWLAMGIPALCLGRRMSSRPVLQYLGGGAALATWDLLLDPMMVGYGYWAWSETLGPVWEGIPVVNFAGWLLTGTVISWTAATLLGPPRREPRSLCALWAWMLGFSVFGFLLPFAFDRPQVGLVSGAAAAVVVVLAYRRRERAWLASSS